MSLISDEIVTSLKEIIDENHLIGIVWSDLRDFEIGIAGKSDELKDCGLLSSLFGGKTQIQNLSRSLDGQILPTIWAQGTYDCFVDVTSNNYIFGVFTGNLNVKSAHFLNEYNRMKEICRTVKDYFETL